MDPHVWPSLYPAIVVGLLVSFASAGSLGWLKALAGMVGGLLGGSVAYFGLGALALGSGAIGSLGMLAASAALAWVFVKLICAQNSTKPPNP